MSSYVWCHGPTCHTNDTQDRIRGVKGSKVLRTRKVAFNSEHINMYSYFCVKVVIMTLLISMFNKS